MLNVAKDIAKLAVLLAAFVAIIMHIALLGGIFRVFGRVLFLWNVQ